MTLTEFLLARIAEDEAGARQASPQRWQTDGEPIDTVYGVAHASFEETASTPANMAHIARHDPTRVLAECEAKRWIVETARDYSPELEHGDNGEWAFDVALRLLALPYADHPDYDESWRP